MDDTAATSMEQGLTIPVSRGITAVQIQREEGGKWDLCDWYSPEQRSYQKRLAVTEGQDLQSWILERWGSGRYRFQLFRNEGKNAGFSSPVDVADPAFPQLGRRHGSPAAVLPSLPVSAGPAPVSVGWPPPGGALPTWQQMAELQERAAERERAASAERLAAIRADEDERRARREREEDDRRRRDREDMEYRAARDREAAKAELEAVRERYRLDGERAKNEHELSLQRLNAERERDRERDRLERERLERERTEPQAFAEAMEDMEERLTEKLRPAVEPPKSELMQAVAPFIPQIVQVLGTLAGAAQKAAAAPRPAPAPIPQGDDGTT